jgi:hypothetical protein
MNPNDEPKPIEYRDGKDDAPQTIPNVRRFVSGGVGGAGIVAFFGFAGLVANLNLQGTAPYPVSPRPWGWIAAFGTVAICGVVLGIYAIRKPRRRFLLAGFPNARGLRAPGPGPSGVPSDPACDGDFHFSTGEGPSSSSACRAKAALASS